MSAEIVRFPMSRVVERRYFHGSYNGSNSTPEIEALHEAQRSVVAASAAIDQQRRSVMLRGWAAHRMNAENLEKWRTHRQWNQARKQALSDFIDRMTGRFSGVDDEHLLRWIDRLKASEPPAPDDVEALKQELGVAAGRCIEANERRKKSPELRHVGETVRGIVDRCEANLPSGDDGGAAA